MKPHLLLSITVFKWPCTKTSVIAKWSSSQVVFELFFSTIDFVHCDIEVGLVDYHHFFSCARSIFVCRETSLALYRTDEQGLLPIREKQNIGTVFPRIVVRALIYETARFFRSKNKVHFGLTFGACTIASVSYIGACTTIRGNTVQCKI